ncbi:MAG: M48 family metallopeptidase [Flavobacteriales bacterium]
MKKYALLFSLVAFTVVSCTRVPITNRKQLNLLPESELIAMAKANYAEFLASANVLPLGDQRAARVKNMGDKLVKSVEKFLKDNHQEKRIKGFEWEFKTVLDPTVNAWCMPGGKVCVYTGILDIATDDDMLAVIMGHELAHAVARHGNERMSQQLSVQGVGSLAGLNKNNPDQANNLFKQSYGIASTLGILRFSRRHETESDKMGLVFMYMAGYKPEKAVDFWEKMSALSGGGKPLEILSTHPSDETRIKDIKEFLPEVPKYVK